MSGLVSLLRPIVRGRRGLVACANPLAVSAGLEMYESGGNAVDAMVASATTLCVVLPHACGLGGDAMLLIARTGGSTVAINGNGAAPMGIGDTIPADGGGTAAVPAAVAALCQAHDQFGIVPRGRVLAPAIRLADDGYPIGEGLLGAAERQRRRLPRSTPDWLFADPALQPGDIVRLPRLPELLGAIARDGPRAFYAGEVAINIARAARLNGGTMQAEDLERYQAIERGPVMSEYRGGLIEVSPPTSQGILLLRAIRRLQRSPVPSRLSERVDRQIRAIAESFAYRNEVARDDAEDRILAGSLENDLSMLGTSTHAGPRGYNHTAAVTTADDMGFVVSGLVSVFDDFGSATLVPEYEFVLNSRLLGFGVGPNAPAPGRRPVHTLAPAIVRQRDAVVGLATPGGDGQVQTLLQIISSVLEEKISLQRAFHGPRWRLVDQAVVVEAGTDSVVIDQLRGLGHQVSVAAAGDELFGAAAAVVSPAGARGLEASTDPRREVWSGSV